jgi:hypothetical protein
MWPSGARQDLSGPRAAPWPPAEQVGRDLHRPVADQDAQGDVLVNDPHRLLDRSAGQVWIVLTLRRKLLGEVRALCPPEKRMASAGFVTNP